MKTVVIPAAGLGSRLGNYTYKFNKGMITLGEKPVISYIIEHFKKTDEIIILLGYKGDLLKQVVKAAYNDWNITFVNVDKFEGEGSGLGYSLSCAIDKLQKPFYFWSNDTIIDEDISKFDITNNWVLGLGPKAINRNDYENLGDYRHFRLLDNHKASKILPKGNYDESTLPYIGVSYIKDYKKFWESWYNNNDLFISTGESAGINNLDSVVGYEVSHWIDTGNRRILDKYKKIFNDKMEATILEKPDEAIWFFDDKVIKFHIDESFITGRVNRFNTLMSEGLKNNNFVLPDLLFFDKNVYVYRKAPGTIVSSIVNEEHFKNVLNYFSSIEQLSIDDLTSCSIYEDFYHNKTVKRIKDYLKTFEDIDDVCVINGLTCMPALQLVECIDFDKLSKNAIWTKNYHGDFHLENILYDDSKKQYVLLDWRQNFGAMSDIGDLYYDIAKLWHSLIVNHTMVKADLFEIEELSPNNYKIDIHRTFIDSECEKQLDAFLRDHDTIDYDQSQLLTALIFLNIAALHIYPYSKFLFFLGKYMLNKANIINEALK